MKKKTIALLTAASLAATALTGCGGEGEKPESVAQDGDGQQDGEQQNG